MNAPAASNHSPSDKEMDLKFKWLDFATAKPSVVPMAKQGTVDEPLGVVLLELHQGELGILKIFAEGLANFHKG